MVVGPNFCDNPNLQNAFNQFRFNVHHSGIGHVSVPVETLGPQDGAPGLHDGQGAELMAGRCD